MNQLQIIKQYQQRILELTNKNEDKVKIIIDLLNREQQLNLKIQQLEQQVEKLSFENQQIKTEILPFSTIQEVKQLVQQFKQIHLELSQQQ